MIRIISILLMSYCIISCNSLENNNEKKGNAIIPFDVLALKMEENINDILRSAGLALKDSIQTSENTLIGNERIAFRSPELLKVNKIHFQNNSKSNLIILHYGKAEEKEAEKYAEKNNVIGLCQLNICDTGSIKMVRKQLIQSLRKPAFDSVFIDNEADIVDNNIVPVKYKFRKEVLAWLSKGMVYYYYSNISERKDNNKGQLFVFKQTQKEWFGFLEGLGFPYIEEIVNRVTTK